MCAVLSLPSTAEGLLINFNASQHEVKKCLSLSSSHRMGLRENYNVKMLKAWLSRYEKIHEFEFSTECRKVHGGKRQK